LIGIKSYGAYLPRYLLPRELIGKAWEFPIVPGTKAIAMADEDSLTMAVEAGLDALSGFDPKKIDGLFYASTTQVYTEKGSASLIATILDMRDDIITTDFTDSLKAGTTAVARAFDTIKANKDIKSILVIASDTRAPEPSTMWEYGFADSAAALLIAEDDNLPLSIDDYFSVSANVTGPWKRADKDKFIRTFEAKMDTRFYFENITKAMAELLKRNNLKPEEISAAAYYYNNPRLHGKVSKIMKFAGGVAQNSVFFQLGDLGTPMPFILLIGSLRRPKPEAKIIMAGFGDGADAILMQVQDRDALRQLGKTRMGLTAHQKSMITLKNYNKFLEYKEFLNKDRYTRKSSPVTIWRDTASVYKWYGIKCKNCGVIQYPDMLRSCYICRADDQFERVKL
jgi:hydroxymethylglutaryl-CoA synthase